MKYKHYSPKARVILFRSDLESSSLRPFLGPNVKFGVLQTGAQRLTIMDSAEMAEGKDLDKVDIIDTLKIKENRIWLDDSENTLSLIQLGPKLADVARELFAALRELDLEAVDVIFVQAVDESLGEVAAAIMNRLRKAAESEIEI